MTRVDSWSSKPIVRKLVYSSSVVVFFALILAPTILGVSLKWNSLGQIMQDQSLLSRALSAVYASFAVAIFVSIVDMVAGIPMAWLIARGKSRWLNLLDTFVDLPLILPTAILGYSFLLFWTSPDQGLSSLFGASPLSPGWMLVILLHFAFSYPAVVRMMVGRILDFRLTYEEAARSLGATPFTFSRTITLPILKPGLIAAFTLAFARSLSETGATLMVAGTFENGPIFIKNAIDSGYNSALVMVSLILILASCVIYGLISYLSSRLKIPIRHVWPGFERKLNDRRLVGSRNAASLLIFASLRLVPSLFVVFPAVQGLLAGEISLQTVVSPGVWRDYWQSILLSYGLGFAVTVVNIGIGLPMAILIARKKVGKALSSILDALVNVPMIIPSVALGVSLRFFWGSFLTSPEFLALFFAHLIITYPYLVRSMTAAIEGINVELEDSARTLGSRPFHIFRSITLPLTKYSLFFGAIMAFTRSVDETGATIAVAPSIKTAPVLLVNWVKGAVKVSPLEISLGTGFLVLLAFTTLLILRLLMRRK